MLSGFGETQRALLTDLLKHKNGLTIGGIVKNLGITRTAVHQHITALERDGYVKKDTLAKTRGRPGQVYVLSNKGTALFPKRYAWFSEMLLDRLQETIGNEGLESFLKEMGEDIADSVRERVSGKSGDALFAEIVSIMVEIGYEASTDSKHGNIINASNCVYHNLACKHEEVCSLDLALLSSLSGRKVKHIECMVRNGQACRFAFEGALNNPNNSEYTTLKSGRDDE